MADTDARADLDAPDLRTRLSRLYTARDEAGSRFRLAMLAFDMVAVGFFVVASFLDPATWIVGVEIALGVVVAADYGIRLWVTPNRLRFVLRPSSLADLLVAFSLLTPAFTESFAFLRVVRAVRLIRAYHILDDLRDRSAFIRRNSEIIGAAVNLGLFLFIATALVYALQHDANPAIGHYVDALYFTVTTLTTTGFGDITLQGTYGRLLSVLIMIFGVSLFLRLAQTIFRPSKVHHECQSCGLTRHDFDAVHCKHCGTVIHIRNEGDV